MSQHTCGDGYTAPLPGRRHGTHQRHGRCRLTRPLHGGSHALAHVAPRASVDSVDGRRQVGRCVPMGNDRNCSGTAPRFARPSPRDCAETSGVSTRLLASWRGLVRTPHIRARELALRLHAPHSPVRKHRRPTGKSVPHGPDRAPHIRARELALMLHAPSSVAFSSRARRGPAG